MLHIVEDEVLQGVLVRLHNLLATAMVPTTADEA